VEEYNQTSRQGCCLPQTGSLGRTALRPSPQHGRKRRTKEYNRDFDFDNTILQSKSVLLATVQNLRLDIALLTDFLAVKDRASSQTHSSISHRFLINKPLRFHTCSYLPPLIRLSFTMGSLLNLPTEILFIIEFFESAPLVCTYRRSCKNSTFSSCSWL
jgi:hypothetical protein